MYITSSWILRLEPPIQSKYINELEYLSIAGSWFSVSPVFKSGEVFLEPTYLGLIIRAVV
jgi:hypothetical protein